METRWKSSYEDHQIHSMIDNFFDSLNTIERDSIESADEIIELNRLEKVVLLIKDNLEAVDPEILPQKQSVQYLNQLSQSFTNIIQFINTYSSSGGIVNLNNANAHADNAIVQHNQLQFIKTRSTARSIAASSRNYSSNVSSMIQDLRNQYTQLTNQITEMAQTLEGLENKTEIDTDSLQNKTESISSRMDEIIEEFGEEKQQVIDKFTKEISLIKENNQNDYKSYQDEKEEEFENISSKLQLNSSMIIEEMQKNKEKAENLLQIVTNIGVTGDFQKNAISQKKNADILRVLALIFMTLAVGGAITIIFLAQKQGFDWQYTLLKLISASTLTLPAGYLARESSKHRTMERKYKRMQLELASIDPFIEQLPEEKRIELKTLLTQKMFAQSDLETTSKENDDNAVSVMNVWKLLEKLATNLSKS